MPYRRFNVQSTTLRLPFWTYSCLPTSSMSNPPRFDFLFGLSRAFPPLQRPIRHAASAILDFLVPYRRFNVQSTTLRLPFWTYSCLPAASTSNPPRRQHRSLRKATTHQLTLHIFPHSNHLLQRSQQFLKRHTVCQRNIHLYSLEYAFFYKCRCFSY